MLAATKIAWNCIVKKPYLSSLLPHSVFLLCSVLMVDVALASGPGTGQGKGHEWASHLHQSGEIRSLEQLLRELPERHQGRMLEAELEQEQGRYVYEVEMLDRMGRLQKFHLDAHSGEVLKDRR